MQFFPQFLTSLFLGCDANLDLHNNLPRLGAWLIDFTSFFLWKILDIVLENRTLSKLCIITGKTFGLLGLYVMKGIISTFLAVFCYLKISGGISLALNMLACISDLGYFCSSNGFFSSLKHFFHIFIFCNGTYSSCKREWYIC